MAVTSKSELDPITEFSDWYDRYEVDERDGTLRTRGAPSRLAQNLCRLFETFKKEHSARVEKYWKYEVMADAEVVSTKPDLPNVSSGEIAGIVRRTARNVVQHTPNVEIVCEFADTEPKGILARYVLQSKIIGEELNSNEMQQNLFTSTMSSFTLGFDAVTPVLVQKADKSWSMEYDAIHYRDVFPDPGVKDAQKSMVFFIRRYLTRSELLRLIRNQDSGWDIAALRTLSQSAVPNRQHESASHQDKKHGVIPEGYEVITWYSTSGDPFLTFDANSKMLLRIEQNRDPLLRTPVHLLVLERDSQQPLGKSQIALVFGRQEFQDLMLNGAMKLWYRNINPSLIGYGTGLNGVPNLSPGKYTNIPNPNAKIEAFEVNTQTLLQFGAISQQNMGSMVNLIGAADQQMAAAAGNGMSATPQGVEAQQSMVDITTNNYQKAVEFFFSKYCSYALTVYFSELRDGGRFTPTADVRRQLIAAGMDAAEFDEEGELKIDLKDMATTYFVRCIPGSLVELEDEKQMRILNQLFIPLSQAMGAMQATGDPSLLANAAAAIQFIVATEIKLSGSANAEQIGKIFTSGVQPEEDAYTARVDMIEEGLGTAVKELTAGAELNSSELSGIKDQLDVLMETQAALLEKLGITSAPSATNSSTQPPAPPQLMAQPTY